MYNIYFISFENYVRLSTTGKYEVYVQQFITLYSVSFKTCTLSYIFRIKFNKSIDV